MKWKLAVFVAFVIAAPVFIVVATCTFIVGVIHVPFAFWKRHSCPLCRWVERHGVNMRLEEQGCRCHLRPAEAATE